MPSEASTSTTRAPLAHTMGDPAGIGPDITLAAWAARDAANLPVFAVLGDPAVFKARAGVLGLDVPVKEIGAPPDASGCFADALPVYPLRLSRDVTPGKPDPESALAVIEAISTATGWVRDGVAAALVTNPINKNLLSKAGFPYPGHTDYLAELCRDGETPLRAVMMLTAGDLRVVPATVHIPLKDVPAALTAQLIVETVNITAQALRTSFGVAAPRIGVTGLNPHAGEEGTLGREEIDVIGPAIQQLAAGGLDVEGPLPADAVYQERSRRAYDAIVAMYHDQALIPVKTLAFDKTVNVTLGLPIVRTSPDHGTAYALAGTGKAHPGSLIESLRLARELAGRKLATA